MLSSAYSPDFGAVVNISVEPLSDDPDTAVAQTINRMADYVRADGAGSIVRDLAGFITQDANTEQDCARRIFQWMKAHVIFYRDSDTAARAGLASPLTTEVLIRPCDLVRMPQPKGDCDCQSMLVAALLRACGIDSNFVTVAADRSQPRVYSHVYVRAQFSDGDSMPLDASHGYYPGWEVENFLGKRREWSIDNPMLLSTGLSGLGDANGDMLTLPDGSIVDLTAGSDPTAGTYTGTIDTSNSDGSSIDWGSIISSSFKTGLNILQTQ